MPHIHTKPNQHDITVSAYIVRSVDGVWQCLVHYHKKFDTLMQIGGHVELDEAPWTSLATELMEEAGYSLSELMIVQPTSRRVRESKPVNHPVPFASNTHYVGNGHYHSDFAYGFVAKNLPMASVADGESSDLRWMSIDELMAAVEKGDALRDMTYIYEFLVATIDEYAVVPASDFSTDKPTGAEVEYKRGAVER